MKNALNKMFKLASLAGLAGTSAMLFFGVTGNAYIDPSVTTYIIQAVAGIVVAVGAVVAVYFRRAKKKLNDKLGLDENRNKEVESDDIVNKQ